MAARGSAEHSPTSRRTARFCTLAEVAAEGTRMNDAACDPQGRFWAGTLVDYHHEGGGALYRLERDGRTELVLDGSTISNGLGWSRDGVTVPRRQRTACHPHLRLRRLHRNDLERARPWR